LNELVESGEREMGLGLHTGRGQHHEAVGARVLARRCDEGGFPDAGLASNDERGAVLPHANHEVLEGAELAFTAHEHG